MALIMTLLIIIIAVLKQKSLIHYKDVIIAVSFLVFFGKLGINLMDCLLRVMKINFE